MFGRLMVAVAAVLLVAGMAALPDLVKPAAGAAARTQAGTVVPTTVTAGGTTKFCGAGFAPGAPIEVLVGTDSAQAVTASTDGGFCLDLRAMAGADGAANLLAVGRTPDGGLLNVTGGAHIRAGAAALEQTAPPAVGPFDFSNRQVVLGLWATAAVLAVLVGLVGVGVQRRRCEFAPAGTPSAQE